MIRLKLGERTLEFDEKRPLSAGDLVAIREMGADPERWIGMVDWVSEEAADRLRTGQYVQLAEALIQVAYLAAVRADHDLRWREFIWSLPIADMNQWDVAVVKNEPAAAVAPKAPSRSKAKAKSAAAR